MNRQTSIQENSLKQAVMELVRKSGKRLTPLDLERIIVRDFGLTGRAARKLIKSLISENSLAYTQQLGRTFAELSTNRPFHAGEGVILAPPDISFTPEPGQILIRIAPGASFGTGDHSTTRIALQLISRIFRTQTLPCPPENAKVLDIGTGTGVLAIAACLMGAAQAVGIDTDNCAQTEAAQNVRLNNLEDYIQIKEDIKATASDDRTSSFPLILANLRYPTLAGMQSFISELASPGGVLVFSGFRDDEAKDLAQTYISSGFRQTDALTENNWAGLVFKKSP
ncbi:MAG: 50S ribosomal protein L11 methyltransferase [Desulfosalsimonas sp.]